MNPQEIQLDPAEIADRAAILEWNKKAAQLLREAPELKTMAGKLAMSNVLEVFNIASDAAIKFASLVGRMA